MQIGISAEFVILCCKIYDIIQLCMLQYKFKNVSIEVKVIIVYSDARAWGGQEATALHPPTPQYLADQSTIF